MKDHGAGATNANARRKSVGSRYSPAASPSNGTYGSCNSSSPVWADRLGPGVGASSAGARNYCSRPPAVRLDANVAQHMVTEVVKNGAVARTIGPAEHLAQKTQRRRLPGAAGAACSPWLMPITCHRIDLLAAAIVRAGSVSTKGLENTLTSRYTLPWREIHRRPAGA
jgi:hypothetical protein